MSTTESLPYQKPPLSPPVFGHSTSLTEDQQHSPTADIMHTLTPFLEARPFKPFKTSEEYLYAMKEDLAEWLHNLYGLNINVDNFFDKLETGVELCQHSNNVRRSAVEQKREVALHGEENPPSRARKNSYTKWDIPPYDVVFRRDVAPGSFFARDNVHNFITWCRDLGVMDVVLFETEDLVMRKNEKHVILSLLEIARRGTRFGMAAPLLVKMEQDIDRELEREQRRAELEEQRRAALEARANGCANGCSNCGGKGCANGCTNCGGNGCANCSGKGCANVCTNCGGNGCTKCGGNGCTCTNGHRANGCGNGCTNCGGRGCTNCGGKGCTCNNGHRANGCGNGLGNGGDGDDGWDTDVEDLAHEDPQLIYGPQAQLVTNDLRSLDEMVRDLVERCHCPSQFPMVKVSDGKYRIGDTKVLIFVRILRNHVMVRVGGGWDTLEHYLDKHDPCRCRAGHRTTLSARVGYKTSNGSTGTSESPRQLGSVTYERDVEGGMSPLFARKFSGSQRGSMRRDSLDSRTSLRQRSQSPASRELFTRTGSGRFSTTPRLSLGGGVRDDIVKPVNGSSEQNGWCDSSSEVSDEGYKSQGPPASSTLPRARKPSPRKHTDMEHRDSQDRPESVMTQLSSEGSSMSTDGNSPPSSPINNKSNSPLADKTNTWNQSKSTIKSPKNSTSKSKIPFIETLKNFASGNKKPKKSCAQEERPVHPAWNSGPGVARQRAHSVGTGRSISRSRSATSEGGFINMARDARDMPPINTVRSPSRRSIGNTSGYSNGKNTWSGRASRERPTLTADTFRPPAPKTVRSASASPATTRRQFGTPMTSVSTNHTPKRSAPNRTYPYNNTSTVTTPTTPTSILDQLADLDADESTLLCIKDIYNSLRAKVSENLAAEGKTLPPELCHDYTSSWINAHSTTGSQSLDSTSDPHNISPRKDGVGSRIPKPTFFMARQTQI
ncbi:unnamed protein product [Meganyctiphanes norvegica]|uniref:GAS2-like protein pickled eggs n=2 Tax=Eumalacostraca TaxID=72041 RepID=A0AAV2R320_MEGNR